MALYPLSLALDGYFHIFFQLATDVWSIAGTPLFLRLWWFDDFVVFCSISHSDWSEKSFRSHDTSMGLGHRSARMQDKLKNRNAHNQVWFENCVATINRNSGVAACSYAEMQHHGFSVVFTTVKIKQSFHFKAREEKSQLQNESWFNFIKCAKVKIASSGVKYRIVFLFRKLNAVESGSVTSRCLLSISELQTFPMRYGCEILEMSSHHKCISATLVSAEHAMQIKQFVVS